MGLDDGGRVEVTRVVIPYVPRDAFRALHDRQQRFACVVAHRRAGKTIACVNELNRAAILCRREQGRFAYVAPYYAQAKDIAWEYAKKYAAPIPGIAINESELRIDYPNGARVRLYGADNYDRMRGGYFDGVVLDEYADMHPAAWAEIIRPMLADRKGWAIFIGTPKGRNAFYDLWQQAADNSDWFRMSLKASESGLLDVEELAAAKADMTPEQYEQEFECSFSAALVGAYYGREIADAERQGRIGDVPLDPALPVHTAWDLGIGDSTAIWFFQIAPDGVRVIDYYENSGQGLSHYCAELATRGYRYGVDWVPHDAKARELGTGRTRIETLVALKRVPRLVPDHRLQDGINATRVSFPRLWIDAEKCKYGIEALRQYRAEYDEAKKVYRDQPRHDWTSHAADAFRYLCMAWREMTPAKDNRPKPISTQPPTLNDLVRSHRERQRYLGSRI